MLKSLFAATSVLFLISGTVVFGQTPTITSVVDAASFSTRLAPGSLASVIGANLGTNTAISVTVGGKACAVLSASPTQLQIQIAVDAPLGSTTLQVGSSAPFNLSLAHLAPVLFSADGTGQGNVQASHADGSAVTTSSPAEAGEVIAIPAIGMGPTVTVVPTGSVSPSAPIAFITNAVQITVAGKAQAALLFAGLVPGKIGVYQVNFAMPPDVTTGLQPIYVTVGGVVSNTLTLPTSDAPVISGLQNNYSYIRAGFPNYGIAQGSIFIISGNNLASTRSFGQPQYPLPTLLDGVSVQVTVNGTTTQAILYYVTPNQLGAILPSSTPVGIGKITVTKNGETGPATPIQVVQSAFGLLTLNQAGVGPAAALDANFRYLGLTNSIQPGEYVNFWGSGLGPATGNEAVLQTPVDLANIPIEVDIGGVPATVAYHGRSNYPGLDQVQVIVPQGVQPGCNVSVVVRTGNIYSNYASIPVALSGRTCSEPELGITSDQLESAVRKPSFTFGTVNLQKDVNFEKDVNGNPQTVPNDRASAQFSRFVPLQFGAANLGNVSIGSCTVYYNSLFGGSTGEFDAGQAINIGSPIGKATLNPSGDDDGSYDEFLGSDTTLPIFIPTAGGSLSFDNGAGGSDVGAFTANLALGAPLVWSNEASITTVNRSNGVTVNWTGGASNSYVQISGMSVTGSGTLAVLNGYFNCAAPVSARQFTVPPAVLLALPPGGSGPPSEPFGTLSVSNITGQQFTAPGLDLGLVSASVNFNNVMVTYQ